jgi:hypothetical protein
MCSVWISEQTVIISLYRINWLAWVRSQVISCHLWWSRWHWDRFFSQYFCFPLSVTFYQCCIIIVYTFLLPEERSLGTYQKSNVFTEIGKHWTFTFFFVCRSDIWTPLWCTTALDCFSLHRLVTTLTLRVGTLTLKKLPCYCICCSIEYLVTADVHCATWVTDEVARGSLNKSACQQAVKITSNKCLNISGWGLLCETWKQNHYGVA